MKRKPATELFELDCWLFMDIDIDQIDIRKRGNRLCQKVT
jgi:hypothetical protein